MHYCLMSLIHLPAANYTDMMHKAAIQCKCTLVLGKNNMHELNDLEAAKIEDLLHKQLSKLLRI